MISISNFVAHQARLALRLPIGGALLLGALAGCGGVDPSSEPPATPPLIAIGEASNLRVRIVADTFTGPDIDEVEKNAHWSTAIPQSLSRNLQLRGFRIVSGNNPADVVVKIIITDVHTASAGSNTWGSFTLLVSNASDDSLLLSHINRHPGVEGYNDWPAIIASDFVDAAVRSPELHAFAQRPSAALTAQAQEAKPASLAPVVVAPSVTPEQPRPTSNVASDHPVFVKGAPQNNAFALVIGVEKYRDLSGPAGARSDAQQFAELAKTTLGVRSENVRLSLDDHATKGDVDRELAWLKGNVPAGGRIYFFFSGHGAPDATNGTPFLLPYDGAPSAVSATALPLAEVMKSLGETKASDVVAIVDTCFSGAGGRSVLPPGARPLVTVKAAQPAARVALFAASSGSEISGPSADGASGLFTKTLLEGLGSGKADFDGDGQISLEEIGNWVKPRVVREAKRENRDQTPVVTVGNGVSASGFILASGVGK